MEVERDEMDARPDPGPLQRVDRARASARRVAEGRRQAGDTRQSSMSIDPLAALPEAHDEQVPCVFIARRPSAGA